MTSVELFTVVLLLRASNKKQAKCAFTVTQICKLCHQHSMEIINEQIIAICIPMDESCKKYGAKKKKKTRIQMMIQFSSVSSSESQISISRLFKHNLQHFCQNLFVLISQCLNSAPSLLRFASYFHARALWASLSHSIFLGTESRLLIHQRVLHLTFSFYLPGSFPH